ncbi:hypothetical protein EMIHUDRAFT_243130 [Emiliania huxleyi CCMP1516]|uniref:C2H2-type domain-containing protein n=2 Tax=Emiliania huxleyi TaxID=2903 RepID=A0A0D3J6U6_EMIH1|nr:hypothetical protein EMIHUDRAFT_243130 [Emiliania huxleyi CCMP1516]EOD19231.1 hypothetical protein EMIHUDRAFT_243130 [Emiliania huxleyi CCMP1516]|eukprot:XP_005771660.1 hypothetical protein EMIHUDRAFT_243130 [Emiliania huxleyi CCMP1516]
MPRVCWGAELSGTRRCRVELAIPYDRVRTLDKDTANKLRMTKTSGAPRYVSRFVCRYNGCGKDYVSMDGVRAHCRKDHPAWLNSLPARKPSLFCEQKQVEIEIATSTAADSMAPVPDEYLHEGEGGALYVKFKPAAASNGASASAAAAGAMVNVHISRLHKDGGRLEQRIMEHFKEKKEQTWQARGLTNVRRSKDRGKPGYTYVIVRVR